MKYDWSGGPTIWIYGDPNGMTVGQVAEEDYGPIGWNAYDLTQPTVVKLARELPTVGRREGRGGKALQAEWPGSCSMTSGRAHRDSAPTRGRIGQPMKFRTFILLAILYAWFGKDGKAQQSGPVSTPQPNCLLQLPTFNQTVFPFNSPAFDNRSVGCTDWTVTVEVPTTISVLSLVVQTAPDNGSGAPGAWSTFAAATGSNPNSVTTGWTATFTTGTSAYYAWLRIQLTSRTGTGSVAAKLFSSITGGGGGGGGGSGCPGTDATPCIVAGPDATNVPPTQNPVLVAGNDNGGSANIQILLTDVNGALIPSVVASPLADGASNTIAAPAGGVGSNPLVYQNRPFLFNGTTWDKQFIGELSHTIVITTAASVIIPGVAATTTRMTAISFSLAAATTVKIVEGTTSATPCDTGQVALSGTYQNVQYFSPPISAAIFTQTQGDDVCIILGGVSTGGGLAQYAQY